MAIRRLLEASTANLPLNVYHALATEPERYPRTVMTSEFGMMLSVPDSEHWASFTDSLLAYSRPLLILLAHACENQCDWVYLDRDAPHLEGFAAFDW